MRPVPSSQSHRDLDSFYFRISLSLVGWLIVLAVVINVWSGVDTKFSFSFPIDTMETAFLVLSVALAASRLKLKMLAALFAVAGMFMVGGAFSLVLSYEVQGLGFPLADASLHAADLAIGFHWEDYVSVIAHNHYLAQFLVFMYNSTGPQLIFVPVLLVLLRPSHELYRYFAVCALATTIGLAVAAFMPAIGMLEWADKVAFNPAKFAAASPPDLVFLMREHRTDLIDLAAPKGLFCFPSFHTLSACFLIYAYRMTFLRVPGYIVGILIMFAAICYGAHYLVDIFAGVSVFLVAVALMRALETHVLNSSVLATPPLPALRFQGEFAN